MMATSTFAHKSGQRPLRTLNILASPQPIRCTSDVSSLTLPGKQRKTAVELLEESKAFYVKSERVLDAKQELPHSDRLQVRSPMLGLSSARGSAVAGSGGAGACGTATHLSRSMSHREFVAAPMVDGSPLVAAAASRVRREGSTTTPPVEKRRLAIRKDNPLPLNVTAVKRLFFSRGTEESQLRKVSVKTSPKVIRVTFNPTSGASQIMSGSSCSLTPPSSGPPKKLKSRLTFCEVLPCICQPQSHASQQRPVDDGSVSTSKPPELPHRMNKKQPSPPPPIPPKSPALNARLRLLSQQSANQQQLPSSRSNQYQHPPSGPILQSLTPGQPIKPDTVPESPNPSIMRRLPGQEAARNGPSEPVSLAAAPNESTRTNPIGQDAARNGPSEPVTSVTSAIDSARMNFIRSAVLHKSLPDLNSPKTRHRCVSGRLRGASTDLGSCSECDSSQMSRSSSVNLDSTDSVSSESSNESSPHLVTSETRPRPRSAAGERATSDYASRSPSFKYETTSLVQASKVWVQPHGWTVVAAEDSPMESRGPGQDRGSAPAFPGDGAGNDSGKRKPILRSKSDVGQSKFALFPEPVIPLMAPAEFGGQVPIELERFFDSIGLDGCCGGTGGTMSPSLSGRSTPVYFSSVSSIDSSCKRRHVDNVYESSDSEDVAATLHRRLLGSQPGMGEPSIVERNARIIKWLIKCRNVPSCTSVGSGTSESRFKHPSTSSLYSAVRDASCLQRKPTSVQSPSLFYGQSTRL